MYDENQVFKLLLDLIVFLIITAIVMVLLMAILETIHSTGPNCPGKDPEWLGFCSEAPDAV